MKIEKYLKWNIFMTIIWHWKQRNVMHDQYCCYYYSRLWSYIEWASVCCIEQSLYCMSLFHQSYVRTSIQTLHFLIDIWAILECIYFTIIIQRIRLDLIRKKHLLDQLCSKESLSKICTVNAHIQLWSDYIFVYFSYF